MENMNRYFSIKERAYKRIEEVREKYKTETHEYLKKHGLHGVVIRNSDGKRGVLKMKQEQDYSIGYELKFYPLRKDGSVSNRCDGYFDWNKELEEQFTPYREGDNE